MDVRRAGARALVAGAVVAALGLPGAAHADTGAFDDPVGDATSVDITRIRVGGRAVSRNRNGSVRLQRERDSVY